MIQELSWTVEDIVKIEDEYKGMSMVMIAPSYSVTLIYKLVKYGLKDQDGKYQSEKIVNAFLNKWTKDGGDLYDLYIQVVKKLEDDGFLAREIGLYQKIVDAKDSMKANKRMSNE